MGIDTGSSTKVGKQIREGYYDDTNPAGSVGTPSGITNITDTLIETYSATTTGGDSQISYFLDGDKLLDAAGVAVSYKKGKLLVSTTINGKKHDITNLPEGFE